MEPLDMEPDEEPDMEPLELDWAMPAAKVRS